MARSRPREPGMVFPLHSVIEHESTATGAQAGDGPRHHHSLVIGTPAGPRRSGTTSGSVACPRRATNPAATAELITGSSTRARLSSHADGHHGCGDERGRGGDVPFEWSAGNSSPRRSPVSVWATYEARAD